MVSCEHAKHRIGSIITHAKTHPLGGRDIAQVAVLVGTAVLELCVTLVDGWNSDIHNGNDFLPHRQCFVGI